VGRGLGMKAVASKESWNGGSGVGTVVVIQAKSKICEGNENLPSDSGQKAGPEFIVSSISSGSTWNHC
jgi:hypothetical protein